jgi:hypothetical protein
MNRTLTLIRDFGWLATAIATVATGVWAITTYLHRAELEYTKDFNSRQLNGVFTAADTVASLISEINSTKWENQKAEFWKLHWGGLIVLENQEIECAMTYLGAKLNVTTFERRRTLGPEVYAVSKALRKFLEEKNNNGWRINLANLIGVKGDAPPLLEVKMDLSEAQREYEEAKKKIDKKCNLIVNTP